MHPLELALADLVDVRMALRDAAARVSAVSSRVGEVAADTAWQSRAAEGFRSRAAELRTELAECGRLIANAEDRALVEAFRLQLRIDRIAQGVR